MNSLKVDEYDDFNGEHHLTVERLFIEYIVIKILNWKTSQGNSQQSNPSLPTWSREKQTNFHRNSPNTHTYGILLLPCAPSPRWYDDEMVRWHDGMMMHWWWHDGIIIRWRWHDGLVIRWRWHDGMIIRWRWYNGMIIRWRWHDGDAMITIVW